MKIPEYESYHEKKNHFDAAFPYNTYLCSIPLDFMQVPLHWHDEVELIYVKKGRGIISVDFTSYEVSAFDIALILPGQLHAIRGITDTVMEYENIIFHAKLLEGSGADDTYYRFLQPIFSMRLACPTILRAGAQGDSDSSPDFEARISMSRLPVPGHDVNRNGSCASALATDVCTKKASVYSAVRACLDENDSICMHFPPGYPLAIKGNLFALFFALCTAGNGRTRTAAPAGKNIEKLKSVIKYVELHYASPMSIEQMAGLAGFSKSHFMKYFRQTMGVPFTAYLNSYRLTMAARLLLQSDDTVLSIASEVGFDNLSYFNRAFKKQYGMTPSTYRGQV